MTPLVLVFLMAANLWFMYLNYAGGNPFASLFNAFIAGFIAAALMMILT